MNAPAKIPTPQPAVVGVCWSGMVEAPFPVRTEAQKAADAIARQDAVSAFRKSPRGKFLTALRGMYELPSYEREICRVEDIFHRQLADVNRPLDIKAVGAALAILNTIPGRDARLAMDALAELLMADTAVAA